MPREIQVRVTIVLLIIYGGVFMYFVRKVFKIVTEIDRVYFSIFTLGIILYGIGEFFMSDFSLKTLGSMFYPVGAIILVISGYMANFALYYLPSFNELRWRDWIKEIYVLYASGIPILHVKISEGKIIKDTSHDEIILAAGVLAALKSALKIITKSKKETALVNQGDVKIIFGVKGKVTIVILAERDSVIIHRKANEFLSMFNKLFKDELESWNGDISVFRAGYNLINAIFLEK